MRGRMHASAHLWTGVLRHNNARHVAHSKLNSPLEPGTREFGDEGLRDELFFRKEGRDGPTLFPHMLTAHHVPFDPVSAVVCRLTHAAPHPTYNHYELMNVSAAVCHPTYNHHGRTHTAFFRAHPTPPYLAPPDLTSPLHDTTCSGRTFLERVPRLRADITTALNSL